VIVVISSCSAKKDDSVPIPKNSRRVSPADYLGNINLVRRLETTRESIFKDPHSKVGTKDTYAFDLYVRAGNAYRHLRTKNENELKEMMLSGKLAWFFLSGGYGIIHAMEPARKYQATLNRTIAHQNKIPFTANYWKGVLNEIVDSLVSKIDPEYAYFFGSQDYAAFIKKSKIWDSLKTARIFESTGSSGPSWLSPIIGELADAIIQDRLNEFNKKYHEFTKQKL
jgi:cytoplasmic iron level regulating protein YaaA (DUF328/UPF0246 family)